MDIGSYQVLLELARGGMGAVYLARTIGPAGVERLVAIKRAHAHLLRASQEVADRFLDEARIAAQLHHSNVIGVHHAGSDEEGYYLVLDYVEGESLNGLIRAARKRDQRVPPEIVLRVACDALAGLHAAHEATDAQGRSLGILHRDVSTQNLLVGRDGVTRLADFGIAKSALSRVVTDERYVQGKLVYLAPEYLRRRPVDRRLDIYAMGMTLWLALAGDSPWPGAEEGQMLYSIMVEGVPPLFETMPELGRELAAVVDRACHLEVTKRFQTAREMLDALERAAASMGGLARHVEVAEFVEAVVGPELAKRRDLVQARREALDRHEDNAQSDIVVKTRAAPVIEVLEEAPTLAQSDASSSRPILGEPQPVDAPVDSHVPAEVIGRESDEPRTFRAMVSMGMVAVLVMTVIYAIRRGSTPSDPASLHDVPAASHAALQPLASSLSAPAARSATPREPAATAIPPDDAANASGSSEPQPAPARSSAIPRRHQRQHPARAVPHVAPFSTVNPYR
jgi:serine/threonine-protein kinase